MNSEALFLRARRRYRALLRESAVLAEKGHKDDLVERELQRIEEEYPLLVENKTVKKEVTASSFYLKSDTNAEPVISRNFSGTNCSTLNNENLEESQAVQNTLEEEGFFCSLNNDRRSRFETADLISFATNCFLLWNGTRLPLSLGVKSCLLIVLFSSISTLLQFELLDPFSLWGKLFSPITLGCVVHLGNFILMRMRRPVFTSMLFRYLFLDVIPSIIMSLVVSVITTILVAMVNK